MSVVVLAEPLPVPGTDPRRMYECPACWPHRVAADYVINFDGASVAFCRVHAWEKAEIHLLLHSEGGFWV